MTFSCPFRKRLSKKRSSLAVEALEPRELLAAAITVNSTADANVRDAVLTLREAILVNNRTLAVGSLSAAEQAQVSGSPTNADRDTIRFDLPASDGQHFYYQNNDGPGVSLGSVMQTSAASDASITDIDPDCPHSWYSIRPAGALPDITDPVLIDGYTQAGASANTNRRRRK